MKTPNAVRGAVVGYVRVSTDEQAREGVSLEAQEAKIRAWWALNGEGRSLIVFRDEGLSGMKGDRPGLLAALGASEKGGALVVYSMSRLSRNNVQLQEIAGALEERGCEFASLSERIDTSSAAGALFFRLMAVLAQFERDLVAERTRSAMAHMRRAGKRISRWGRVPNEVRRRMLELRAEGLSLRAIGRRLVEEGIMPLGGGQVWSAKVVKQVLERAEEAA